MARSYLNVSLKNGGRGVLDVVRDLVEALRGGQDNDAGRRAFVQLELVVAEVGARHGSAASSEALAGVGFERELVHAFVDLNRDLESTPGPELDDEGGGLVTAVRGFELDLGQDSVIGKFDDGIQTSMGGLKCSYWTCKP